MSLGQIMDIAGSGMSAQSIRLNTTSSNLANAQSVSSSAEGTYKARKPVFETMHYDQMNHSLDGAQSSGVQVSHIMEADTPLQARHEPSHPKANEEGYVYYPNVNVVEEMADMIAASRSYQMQIEVMNTAKQMLQRTLTLGQ